MRAARTLALVAACLPVLWPQLGAHADVQTILLVSPTAGYNGDTFYLSGSGYLPRDQLAFYIACPDLGSPDVYYYRNAHYYPGPVVNGNGTFAGFPIRGFNLNVLKTSPCVIEVNDVSAKTYFVCKTLCALYDIVAPDTALPRSARLISGTVRARPQRVHAGVTEHISISGSWGGAWAVISVQIPHQRARKIRPIHMNWEGAGNAQVTIGKSVGEEPGKATVSVAFTLEDRRGSAGTSFTVIH
jgi:hypothetical protein